MKGQGTENNCTTENRIKSNSVSSNQAAALKTPLAGREAKEGRDICLHTADSQGWTAETNTTVGSNNAPTESPPPPKETKTKN